MYRGLDFPFVVRSSGIETINGDVGRCANIRESVRLMSTLDYYLPLTNMHGFQAYEETSFLLLILDFKTSLNR